MQSSFSPASPVGARPHDIRGLSSLPDLSSGAHRRSLFTAEAVLSPVTNLAMDMDNLIGLGSHCNTPNRKRHALLEKVPSFASDVSSDAGLGQDLPSPVDSEVEDSFEKSIQHSSRVFNERMPLRRNSSLPLQLQCFSPPLKGQETHAQRYGRFGQKPSHLTLPSISQQEDKENMAEEGFEFKKPTRPVSRCRGRSFNNDHTKEAFAQRPSSAPALMLSSPTLVQQLVFCDSSPEFLRRSSLTSSLNDDDGFLEVLDDNMENDSMPMGMASLLTAPLVDSTLDDSPVIRCRPRSLFRSPSMPSPASRTAMKRSDCTRDENTPVRVKRRRSLAEVQVSSVDMAAESSQMVCSPLQRSRSSADIEELLDRGDNSGDLIGDFTKPFLLPTVDGKHQDLKYITPETVDAALTGNLDHVAERVIIIDCRYPYEFEGGHLKGALNLHLEEQVHDYFFKQPIKASSPEQRIVIIFHCEFSSERGPRMCRYMREQDRTMNEYPNLHYPELYVLKGGYKEFFQHFQVRCEPQSYRPMLHEDFKEDLRKFRLKSRTWAGERSKRDMYSRLKKL
ncbi:M-phase inducer phosphatase 2 [Synchiropus splendidus]|uniref:M-phase inducer phosphatase 2 n=1 Tax=Synchiropus splendidus TaxID=270530 RepID=UPI00237E6C33|nr:M-phase inducer phosphatase 2 [Synchiropus splendidus]